MKYKHLLRVTRGSLPDRVFDQICALAPEGRKAHGFHLEFFSESADGGDIARNIAAICSANGLHQRRVPGAGAFGHSADRWYGEECYQKAEFLILNRQNKIQGLTQPIRDEKGRLLLVASNAKRSLKVGRIFPNWIIVSHKVRKVLEAGGLVGLQFAPVALQGHSINASPEPFWELQSSIVLPGMANKHRFIHPGLTEVEPFTGDFTKTVMINDPPFSKGEVHYRRADLAAVVPFDIGTTFEKYMEPHAALVISQRFYRHCLASGIPLAVDPVRVDP
jgi:hypothetical protein